MTMDALDVSRGASVTADPAWPDILYLAHRLPYPPTRETASRHSTCSGRSRSGPRYSWPAWTTSPRPRGPSPPSSAIASGWRSFDWDGGAAGPGPWARLPLAIRRPRGPSVLRLSLQTPGRCWSRYPGAIRLRPVELLAGSVDPGLQRAGSSGHPPRIFLQNLTSDEPEGIDCARDPEGAGPGGACWDRNPNAARLRRWASDTKSPPSNECSPYNRSAAS